MKYREIVKKLNYMHNDGYFNNHHSPDTHGTGPYNQFAYTTIGTCDCSDCIAHALAFGIDDHYQDNEITEEIAEKLKGIYGIENLTDALREEEKGFHLTFK